MLDVQYACSVKDRISMAMIQRAEDQGLISPNKTLLVCYASQIQRLKPIVAEQRSMQHVLVVWQLSTSASFFKS